MGTDSIFKPWSLITFCCLSENEGLPSFLADIPLFLVLLVLVGALAISFFALYF